MTARTNQKRRTHRALLDAAVLLVRAGRTPAIAEVAEAADVSTATAYRYFPNTQALMLELANRETTRRIDRVVCGLPEDAEQRIDMLAGAMARFHLEDEMLWRGVLSARLTQRRTQADILSPGHPPDHGGGGLQAVYAALAPLSESLGPRRYRRLVMATMMVCGIEAVIAAREACALEPTEAREVIQWAARALLRTAVQDRGGDASSGGH